MADSVMGPTDGAGPGPENVMPPGNHTETHKALVFGLWGVISNEPVYFQAAIKQFYITLDHARADGSHGWEVRKGTTGSKRSTRGLVKMNQVLNFVTIIAEIAANQGYDLYPIQNKRGVDFHKMVEFLVEASTNKNLKTSYNDSSIQDTRFLRGTKGSTNLAWAEAHVRRFPDRPVSEKLAGLLPKFGITARMVVGGSATCIYRDIGAAEEYMRTKTNAPEPNRPKPYCLNKEANKTYKNPGNCEAGDEGISFKEYANWKKENKPTDSKTKEKKTHCYNPDSNTLTKSRMCLKENRVTQEEGEALVKQGN